MFYSFNKFKIYIYNSFILVFIFEIIDSFSFSDIWLYLKSNISNLSNLTFSNTFISDILLLYKYNSFNSLKLTFSKISIFDILLLPKSNFCNFSNFNFSNTFISDILL